MKKIIITIAIVATTIFVHAQKYAYVDTEYILDNISEYKEAQKKLDAVSAEWQKEIQKKYEEIETMYKKYQAEQVLLTEEMKKKREDEIVSKEKAAKELQKQRFGYEGDLFKKRQELVKPIQDKVYDAIKKMAETKAYDFVFDKSAGVAMLYSNPKLDKSDDILRDMGYVPGSKTDTNTNQEKTK